jgi:protein TonB
MTARTDIYEDRQSVGGPFAASVLFHCAVVGAALFYGWVAMRGTETWGDPKGSGGAIGITPVSKIPLPGQLGRENRVANDTESTVPQKPIEKRAKPVERDDDDDAIALKSKRAKKSRAEVAASMQRYRPEREYSSNQVYSRSGQGLNSPMYGGQSGSGGVGIGTGNPFGNRFGSYLEILRQRVSQKWRYGEVDPRMRSAPAVVVRFVLERNGTISGVALIQRSGNYTLDTSAQRAVLEAAPFPPIPAGYERSSATLEFEFRLQR